VWDKVKHHVTPMEWRIQAPLIVEINRLKREKNAVILAHNYMTPEIFHGVGDFVGDSLALAREAAKCDAKRDRPGRRALHGRDQQGAGPRQDRPDPRPEGRLQPGLLDHRRRRAADQAALSGHPGGHLCQHHRRREGRDRHLLHQRQRRAGGGVGGQGMGRRQGHPDPRRVPGPQRRGARPTSRSSPGPAAARCTSASPAPTSPTCAPPIRAPRSWPTRNARPRSCRPPTSPARRRR
jgi:hypothetical protein